MDALLLALMTWIQAASGLPMPDAPPTVARVSPQRMAELADPTAAGSARPSARSGYLALYHLESRTILLRPDWRAEDLRDRSILLHELVHHMQAESGQAYPCPGAREREAYELQARWLDERGADLFQLMGMNGLFFHALTRC